MVLAPPPPHHLSMKQGNLFCFCHIEISQIMALNVVHLISSKRSQ
jgi:hypothetical protein